MDIGFVIVSIAIFMPFMIVLAAFKLRKKRESEFRTRQLLQRIGLSSLNANQITKPKLSFVKNLPVLSWLQSQLKQAGLVERKDLVKLIITQAGLLFISAYLIATGFENIDEKTWFLAMILPLLPIVFVVVRLKQRQAKIKKQFPEMLEALVRALQSGYGIDGAMNLIANEFPAPLGQEIKDVNAQLQLGISMRDILREFQRRVTLAEAQYFVVTLIIQRETGGQLTDILMSLAKMMRRRERFQAKLSTMTAESRFTAIFIGGVPIIYLLYKYLFDPKSMAFFLTDPTGQRMLILSLLLIGSGTLLLRMMLKIRF